MKRNLLALPSAFCLIYSALLIWSFWGNRELEQGVLASARGIAVAEGASGAAPGIDSLHKLETLRQTLANLTKWSDRTPLRLSFGLYKGNDIRDDVRKLYYARFGPLLFESAQQQMLTYLQLSSTAPGPSDDYNLAYDTLKSYLLTTSEWKRTADTTLQSFLGSQLETRWAADNETEIGKERLALAKAQFDFYVSDLHNGNPYSEVADEAAVRKSRIYLSNFAARQHAGERWALGLEQGQIGSGHVP